MSPEKQAVLDALNAERYGPSLWWSKPEPDDAAATARRQMLLTAVDNEEGAA